MSVEAVVVVATRDRARRLEALLDALEHQRTKPSEVIVVDDGSTDGTAKLVSLRAGSGAVRLIRHDRPKGPAAARNAGWRSAGASTDLVAFLDDDCRPGTDGWLTALIEAYRAAPGGVIQGRTEPDPAELPSMTAFSRTVHVERAGPWYESCNIAYPRLLLERLGGFDESFPAPAGEDTDLGWRAAESGASIVYCPEALVHHAVQVTGALGLVRDARRWESISRVVARHPRLREHLVLRVFWKESHACFVLAAIGVALAAPSRSATLALTAPYAMHFRPWHSSMAGTLASLPAHVAVDLAEVAVLTAASIRERTIVI